MSIDPGFSNGCKCAIIACDGSPLDTFRVFLNQERKMTETISRKIDQFQIEKICIGDGCGNADAERVIGQLIESRKKVNTEFCRIREAGASVYSCSKIGCEDLPNSEPGERGAITLARRIINPIGELVKVIPESMGIGKDLIVK